MITVNNNPHPFTPGMTVKSLLDEKNYVFPLLVVKLNGRVVEDADFPTEELRDGDDLKVIHVFAGG